MNSLPTRGRSIVRWWTACAVICCCISAHAATAETSAWRVLALRSTSFFATSHVYDQAMADTLASKVARRVEIYPEVIDPVRFAGMDLDQELQALLRKKYAGQRPDLIVASGRFALEFAGRNRDTLWPGVPVVFYNVIEEFVRGRTFPADFSGVTVSFSPERTLELATRLQPDAAHLVVIAGTAEYDRTWLKRLAPLLRKYESRYATRYLTHHTVAQLVDEVRRLPPRSIVFYVSVVRDADGRNYLPRDVAKQIAEHTAAPVYSHLEGMFGQGVVGGVVPHLKDQGTQAGELAARVLTGAGSATIRPSPPLRCVVDDRQLRRWSISESRVPGGCSIEFREPTFWQQYWGYVVGALIIVLLQAVLIGALLINRALRIRSNRALDERLAFERLVSDLSARLLSAAVDTVDAEIEKALAGVVAAMRLDRCSLFAYDPQMAEIRISHSVDASGVALRKRMAPARLLWLQRQLTHGITVILDDIGGQLPASATAELNYAKRYGLKSVVIVPIAAGDGAICGVSYQSKRYRDWETDLVSRLQLVAEILVSALAEKRALSALRVSEERLRVALEAGRIGIWDWDRTTNVVQRSDAYLTGIGEHAFAEGASFEAWMQGVHPDDRARTEAAVAGAIASRTHVRCEYRVLRPDATHRWLEMHANPIYRDDGVCARVTGITLDVTDRKRVQEATVQLAQVSRVAVVGELTGSIAHEINQPLGAILSNAEAAELLLKSDAADLPELRKIAADIRKDTVRAGEVVSHMRELLRTSALSMESFDLNQAVLDVVNLVTVDFSKRDVTIATRLATLPMVRGDRVHVQQVLLNLIQNGADAMAGVAVSSRVLSIRTVYFEDHGVEVIVSDAGPGIPFDQPERLFDSFYTTKKEGMGLGLSIAKSIVEAHHGRIWAESRAGAGATFKFFLPLDPAKSDGQKAPSARARLQVVKFPVTTEGGRARHPSG